MASRWATRTRARLPRLADPRQPRVLPRLEREAAAAGRARAVRLRARGLHRAASGSPRGSPPTTSDLLVRRAGLSSVEEYLIDGLGADDPRRCRPTPGRLVQPLETASFDAWIKYYRRDENTPNTADQLLHQGRRRRLPARRQDPQGDRRREEPRRRAAARLRALLGRQGLHRRARFQAVVQEVAGTRPRRVVDVGARRRPRSSTTTRRSTGSACASSRSTHGRAKPGKAWLGATTEERRRPPGVNAGEARHASAPGGPQRRRRDPRHRRLPRPRRRARCAPRAVPAGRAVIAAGGAARRADAASGHAGPRAGGHLASRAAAGRDAGAAGPPQGVDGRIDDVVGNALTSRGRASTRAWPRS